MEGELALPRARGIRRRYRYWALAEVSHLRVPTGHRFSLWKWERRRDLFPLEPSPREYLSSAGVECFPSE